jgi:hypothetical protein
MTKETKSLILASPRQSQQMKGIFSGELAFFKNKKIFLIFKIIITPRI